MEAKRPGNASETELAATKDEDYSDIIAELDETGILIGASELSRLVKC